jgi:hypothetical protein
MSALAVTITILVVVGAIGHLAVSTSRHRRNLNDLLRPMVEANGLELLDSRPRPMFRTGPFPWLRFKVLKVKTTVLGLSGEYSTFRIVRVRSAGHVIDVWVRLDFQAFELLEAEWKPPLASLAAA